MNGSKILILGLAYKKNIDDPRESPSIEILDQLHQLGADISYHDPFIPKFPKMRRYSYKLSSIELKKENLMKLDAEILTTDHD